MHLARPLLAMTFFVAALRAEPPPASEAVLAPLVAHVAAHRDGHAPASLDFSALQGDRTQLPIGVFDSGIGGLTVLEALLALDGFDNRTLQPGADGVPDFAGERFVYFGDQANMPYGNYPARGAETFLRELTVRDAIFLLGRRYHAGGNAVRFDKPPVKAIVIACNTATAYGIEDVRAALRAWNLDMPVIGVVEAGARAVSATLLPEGESGAVAVLATVGTCSSGAYPRAIGRAGGLGGKHVPPVIQQGSVGLAGALEGNPAFVCAAPVARTSSYLGPAVANPDAPLDPALRAAYDFDMAHMLGDPASPSTWQLNSPANYVHYDVVSLLENYRRRGGGPPIATVVLGCTHFPIVEKEFVSVLARLRDFRDASGAQPYRALIAEKPVFVNPAELTAKALFRELAARRLRAGKDSMQPPAVVGAFVSVANPAWPGVKLDAGGGLDSDYKYSRSTGQPEREDVHCVPMSEQPALLQSLSNLAPALPRVWHALNDPAVAERREGNTR
jgi:glutamate racemase